MTSIDRAGNVIKYSIATMHPKDDFKKPLGRKIAEGRLAENPAIVWVESVPESGHIISRLIMTDIVARFEQTTKFKRDYILKTYGNNWAYHIPARVAKAAQRWINEANKPREIDSCGKTEKEIMTDVVARMDNHKVWTPQDLTSKSNGLLTNPGMTVDELALKDEAIRLQMSRPTVVATTVASNPKGFIKYGADDYAEWVKNGKLDEVDFVRVPAEEVQQVKKTPKFSFSNAEQQTNYEVFQKALPEMLTNKFIAGKFAIVYGKEIKTFFSTYREALEYALSKYRVDEFIIQEVADNTTRAYKQKSA
jgi:hypothetical protein